MTKPKIIKAYVTKVLLVLFIITGAAHSCSSSNNRTSRIEREKKDSAFLVLIQQITERLDAERTTNMQFRHDDYRTIITFDTTQPADTTTGLPPISSVEVSGSAKELNKQIQEKLSYEKNDSLALEAEEGSEENYIENTETQKDVDVGTDISGAISIGIIILVIVISIIIIIYVRSHSSKQSN